MAVTLKSLWLCILVLLSLSTSVLGAEPEAERLHVGYSIYAGVTAPLWATKEAGLFEKNGLNVQLVYLRGGTEAAQALITGDIPFAMMGGGAVIASNLAGSGSVILAGIENAILFKLVTAKEIDSGEKLRGKNSASHPWAAPPIWPLCAPCSILALERMTRPFWQWAVGRPD